MTTPIFRPTLVICAAAALVSAAACQQQTPPAATNAGPVAQPAAASAPIATVGDLIQAGGHQLKRQEILSAFAGATIEGAAMGHPESKFVLQYAAGGAATGKGWSPTGWAPISGTWSANDHDQYCQDLQVQGGGPITGCFFYFALGDRYFASPSDENTAPVYERKLTH